MQHRGKAAGAGWRMIGTSLGIVLVLGIAFRLVLPPEGWASRLTWGLGFLWLGFLGFVLNFFRDPDPAVPANPLEVASPAHGLVDAVGEIDEPEWMGGRCRRISIFLSVFDVHVQHVPAAARVALVRHRSGRFLNAMRADSALVNENVLIGLEPELGGGGRMGVRLIAGLIARRILPWIGEGDRVRTGDRLSLIQFGSRVDLYLPLEAEVCVRVGERVRGGETVVARWETGRA